MPAHLGSPGESEDLTEGRHEAVWWSLGCPPYKIHQTFGTQPLAYPLRLIYALPNVCG